MNPSLRILLTLGASGLISNLSACEDRQETGPGPKTVVPVAGEPGVVDDDPIPSANTSTTIANTSTTIAKPTGDNAAAPAWVTGKSSYTDEDGTRYGVGHASGIKNASLARQTAGNRARAEIAKLVSTPIEVKQGDGSKTVKVYSTTVNGVEIVDHWVDPKTGAVYALARLKP